MEKYKIEEYRFTNKTSYFILKRKVFFWWEKVYVFDLNSLSDPFTFVTLKTGVDIVDKNKGQLVGIYLEKINRKKK